MKAFLGYGELGRQIQAFLEEEDNEKINACFFDDLIFDDSKEIRSYDSFTEYIQDYEWIVSLGYKHLMEKQRVINILLSKNAKLVTLKHSSSYISKKAQIKDGVIIYPMCNIDKEVIVEAGVLINNSVTVSHNSTIGACSYISPGVIISGNVQIGSACFIGTGSLISNGITIGNNSTIGIGSVITHNIPPNSNILGNPAKFLNKPLKLL
jgi:sugar O-acyltransferase (sialic acid O-acetyltransferase NeuD family)